MAKRKDLKKDVDFLCNEIRLEILCNLVQKQIDEENFDGLVTRIDKLNEEFRNRIQRPAGNADKKLVKAYYKRLLQDFNEETDKIYSELKSLNREKSTH